MYDISIIMPVYYELCCYEKPFLSKWISYFSAFIFMSKEFLSFWEWFFISCCSRVYFLFIIMTTILFGVIYVNVFGKWSWLFLILLNLWNNIFDWIWERNIYVDVYTLPQPQYSMYWAHRLTQLNIYDESIDTRR